jgi:hypothetical protein
MRSPFCVCVCVCPLLTFEWQDQSPWNLVRMPCHLRQSQRQILEIHLLGTTSTTASQKLYVIPLILLEFLIRLSWNLVCMYVWMTSITITKLRESWSNALWSLLRVIIHHIRQQCKTVLPSTPPISLICCTVSRKSWHGRTESFTWRRCRRVWKSCKLVLRK